MGIVFTSLKRLFADCYIGDSGGMCVGMYMREVQGLAARREDSGNNTSTIERRKKGVNSTLERDSH